MDTLPVQTTCSHLNVRADEPEPAPLCVYAHEERIADVASQDHADVQSIIDTGLELTVKLMTETAPATLLLSLATTETES